MRGEEQGLAAIRAMRQGGENDLYIIQERNLDDIFQVPAEWFSSSGWNTTCWCPFFFYGWNLPGSSTPGFCQW
jgi:hypothetical protein